MSDASNCTQDVLVYMDYSLSVGVAEQERQREFIQVVINSTFEIAASESSLRYQATMFARDLDHKILLDDPEATDKDALLALYDQSMEAVKFTSHRSVFEDVNTRFSSLAARPVTSQYDVNTGLGLTLILISDGSPYEPNMGRNKAENHAIKQRNKLVESLPGIKIYCFTAREISREVRSYYNSICDGYWFIRDATSSVKLMAEIATTKICESPDAL